jgi:hypothetical protein
VGRLGATVALRALALGIVASIAAASSGLSATPAAQWAWGWVYVRVASGYSSYTPLQSDSAGNGYGDSLVTHLGTGHYRVTMNGTGDDYGNVQVTPVNKVVRMCTAEGWSNTGTDETIEVLCWNAAGHRADTPFVVDYNDGDYRLSDDADAGLAYAFIFSADQPNPTGPYIYNSNGESTSVQHPSTGRALVKFFGFHSAGGNVQVTAVGDAPGVCNAQGWQQDGTFRQEGTQITVVCRDAAGALTDRAFSILYSLHTAPATQGAYALANKPGTASYVPSATYRWPHTGTGTIGHVSRSAKGVYGVRLDGWTPPGSLAALTGGPEVKAVGDGTRRCQLTSLPNNGDPRTIGVRCFDLQEHPADSKFAFLFLYSAGE